MLGRSKGRERIFYLNRFFIQIVVLALTLFREDSQNEEQISFPWQEWQDKLEEFWGISFLRGRVLSSWPLIQRVAPHRIPRRYHFSISAAWLRPLEILIRWNPCHGCITSLRRGVPAVSNGMSRGLADPVGSTAKPRGSA